MYLGGLKDSCGGLRGADHGVPVGPWVRTLLLWATSSSEAIVSHFLSIYGIRRRILETTV